jgi:glycerophosphoryl diester phosphodiesterase
MKFMIIAVITMLCIIGQVCNKKPFTHLKRPVILSHRGSLLLRPENTIDTMHTVLQIGAHVLELDVRLTKDDQLVVYHDEMINRTTNGTGLVRSYTLKELQLFDAAYHYTYDGKEFGYRGKGVTIPALRQFLNELWGEPEDVTSSNRTLVSMNIELKDDNILSADKCIEELKRYDLKRIQSYVSVTSRFCDVLCYFREKAPEIPTSACETEVIKFYLSSKIRTGIASLNFGNRALEKMIFGAFTKPLPYSSLQIPYKLGVSLFSEDIIRHAHEQGLEVHYWIVNEKPLMKTLITLGSDALITDRTDLAVELFKELGNYYAPKYELPKHIKSFPYHIPLKYIPDTYKCLGVTCLIVSNFGIFFSILMLLISIITYWTIYKCCSKMIRKVQKNKKE